MENLSFTPNNTMPTNLHSYDYICHHADNRLMDITIHGDNLVVGNKSYTITGAIDGDYAGIVRQFLLNYTIRE